MNNDKTLIIFLLLILSLPVAIVIISWIIDFSRDLKYVNMEIKRTRGNERKEWKKRRRKLIFSIFKFK